MRQSERNIFSEEANQKEKWCKRGKLRGEAVPKTKRERELFPKRQRERSFTKETSGMEVLPVNHKGELQRN